MMTMLTGLTALMVLASPMIGAGGETDGVKSESVKEEKSLPVAGDKMLEVLSTIEMTGQVLMNPFPWIGPVLDAKIKKDYSGRTSLLSDGESYRRLEHDQLFELLLEMADVNLDTDGVSLQAVDGKLIMVHEQAAITKMTGAYRRIRDSTSPRIQIQYVLFDAGGSAESLRPATLGEKESLALMAGVMNGSIGRLLYRGSATARTGDSIGMGAFTHTAFVGDLKAEIAQDSSAGDPVTIPLKLGQGLTLRPLLAPNGEDVVFLGMFNSRTLHDGVQTERVVAEDFKSIDQVRIDMRQSVFSLRLGDLQGCLLAPGGAAAPNLRAFFFLRRLDAKPQDLDQLALIPTALIASNALRARSHEDRAPYWLNEKGLSMDAVAEAVRNLASSETVESRVEPFPEFLLVKGKGASAAKRIVDKLSANLGRSYVVEIHREVKAIEDPHSQWQPFGESIQIPCMGRRLGYAMSGYEQSYTWDYNVEVAQKANIGVPKQAACFVGFRGWSAVIPMGESALVYLDLRDSSLKDWRRVLATTDVVGDISIPMIDEAHVVRQLRLSKNESQSLGDGAPRILHGIPHRTRLTVKLIER